MAVMKYEYLWQLHTHGMCFTLNSHVHHFEHNYLVLQTFINKCLRQIMNIKWTDNITNEEP